MMDREVLTVELVGTDATEKVVRIATRRDDGRTTVRSLHPAPLECAQHAARRLAAHHGLMPVGANRWERAATPTTRRGTLALEGELAS